MSYKFKGEIVIINGTEQILLPGPLPESPLNGHIAIDEQDGFFKVYNEQQSKWLIFSNSSNKKHFLEYQYIGQMNYSQYLFAGAFNSLVGPRSGDQSNGYRYSNSAPRIAPFSGDVTQAVVRIEGVAQSTGSAAAEVTCVFELWRVGTNGSEGTKLGDINFVIDTNSYNIGTYWNSSIITDYKGTTATDVAVTEGDLLGLKFIRQTGNSSVVSVNNVTLILTLEE